MWDGYCSILGSQFFHIHHGPGQPPTRYIHTYIYIIMLPHLDLKRLSEFDHTDPSSRRVCSKSLCSPWNWSTRCRVHRAFTAENGAICLDRHWDLLILWSSAWWFGTMEFPGESMVNHWNNNISAWWFGTWSLASGNLLHSYWTWHFLMGKSTILTGPFSIAM